MSKASSNDWQAVAKKAQKNAANPPAWLCGVCNSPGAPAPGELCPACSASDQLPLFPRRQVHCRVSAMRAAGWS